MLNSHQLGQKIRGYISALTLVWLALGAFGVTTSSLALNYSTTQNNSANVIWGHPQSIRSDEWIRSTPSSFAEFQPNWSIKNLTPFEAGNFREQTSAVRSIEKIVFFEPTLFHQIKSFKAFALLSWLPLFGVLIFGYLLFMEIGLKKTTSILGPILIVASGPVVWWSFALLNILYPAFAGSFLLLRALNSPSKDIDKFTRLYRKPLLILGSSIFLVRMPWLYAPWSIPVTLSFAFLLLPCLFYKRKIVDLLKIVAPQVALMVFISLLIYISRRDRILALNDTIYPGQRRSTGGINGVNKGLTWSGPFAWILQSQENSKVVSSNLSEVARGLTILIVPTLLMLIQNLRKWHADLRVRIAMLNLGFISLCLLWEMFVWPNKFIFGYLFGFVPGERMSQLVGVLVVIPFILMLDVHFHEQNHSRKKSFLTTGLLVIGYLVFSSGISLKNDFLPSISHLNLILTTVIFSTVFVSFYFLKMKQFCTLVGAISILSVIGVNPITVGSGDLLQSSAAHVVGSIKNTDIEGRWATDDLFTDALVTASGASMLAGQQFWGPNKDAWQIVDPSLNNEPVWNRGASSIILRWDVGLLYAKFESPQSDLILITVDPCSPMLSEFNLNFVMASRPLDASCLKLLKVIKWTGVDRWIYQRDFPA